MFEVLFSKNKRFSIVKTMLQIFIFLLFYKRKIKVASDILPIYYNSFQFLEFGFKKNAEFRIQINNSLVKMVFGLATKQELSSISKHKYNKQYCDGSYRLSQIQYIISKNTEIHSNITSKGVLRPYSFACSGENSFTIGLDIKNRIRTNLFSLFYCFIYNFINLFYSNST